MCYFAPGVEQVVAPSAHSYLSPRDHSATPVAERWVKVSNGRRLTQARHGSQDAKQVAAISELRGAIGPRLTQGAVEATDLTVDAILATALTSNVDARFLAPIPSRNDLSALA